MADKIYSPRKTALIVRATWTGEFPLHLLAAEQATIRAEQFSRPIEDSLAPYIGAEQRTVELVKFIEKPDLSMVFVNKKVYPSLGNWNVEEWVKEGVHLEFVDSRPIDTRRYIQYLKVTFTQFPVDMMRYDRAFPASREQAKVIADSLRSVDRKRHTVILAKLTDTKTASNRWGQDRWNSYPSVKKLELISTMVE